MLSLDFHLRHIVWMCRAMWQSSQSFFNNFSAIRCTHLIDVACTVGAFYTAVKVFQVAQCRLKTTALCGPPNPSLVWGISKMLFESPDSGAQVEKWAEEYGGVYEIPMVLGERRIFLCDPKAIAHLFGGEPWTYVLTPFGRLLAETIVGKEILSASGEHHHKLRKLLAPAFSNAAIRNLTHVFYGVAYKAKGMWDHLIESNDGSAIIEVQSWMNHISLDTIGIAVFSHDFGSLDGKPTPVTEILDAFGSGGGSTMNLFIITLAQAFPALLKLPTPYSKLIKRLNHETSEISNALLTRSKREKEAGILGVREEKSILGRLTKAESKESRDPLKREVVTGLAKVLLVAGYETTSISLTWALIELSRNPDIQSKLRAELVAFGVEPTYDQFANQLPYLDAVVHETLRMHPPLQEFTRMATVDDVIPLSKPVRTRSGTLIDHISVARGAYLTVSAPSVNRSTALWGPDAKVFRPERWIEEDGISAGAREVQGHRHLLTFIDGPRTCLGKGFAIAEFKIVLSVLVRHFVFKLEGGPETTIEKSRGILPRPKVAGEDGAAVPLHVRRVE